ncbi:MAG: pilus assembly protein [Pseudomonadota bacterium]
MGTARIQQFIACRAASFPRDNRKTHSWIRSPVSCAPRKTGQALMKTFSLLRSLASKFRSNRSGNFTIYLGVVAPVIFLASGMAVDYSMLLQTKTRVGNALDAAALATGRALSAEEMSADGDEAEDYFKAVFAANMGDDAFETDVYTLESFTVDEDAKTVSGSVSVDRDLSLLPVGLNKTSQTVSNYSAINYGVDTIEIALVLDITGSMTYMGSNGESKITNLKKAAKLIVQELLAANTQTTDYVRISIVPYNHTVNAGPLAGYVYPDYNEPTSDAPVYQRGFGFFYDVKTHLEAYGAQCTLRNSTGRKKYVCTGIPDDFDVRTTGGRMHDCATDRKAPKTSGKTSYQYTDADPSYGMISSDSRLQTEKTSYFRCHDAALVPLTSDMTTLTDAIDGLVAEGSTAGHVGLQWGWYTISPNWADYMPAGSEPYDFATKDRLRKYIILMTDGEFNTAYADVDDPYNEFHNQNQVAKTHTEALCTAIKSNRIRIFTIGYETSDDADAILEDCASPDIWNMTFFYTPDSAEELEETFATIAELIQQLIITN